jgi:hypothetical protein
MKFDKITENIAIIILALYGVYALFVTGIGSLILAGAIGLIAAAFTDKMEIIAAAVVIVGMIIGAVGAMWRCRGQEGFSGGSPVEISQRVEKMARKQPVQGVYNNEVEGFANVDGKEQEGAPAESVSASSARKDEVPAAVAAPVVAAAKAAEAAKPAEPAKPAAPVESAPMAAQLPSATQQGFKSESSLFRLGEMPSEKKDGPFLDASSTLMRAIGALQPEQVKSMTEETQKMIETQKNMMTMLQSMRPVLQDGRQLLESFSGIFGAGKL